MRQFLELDRELLLIWGLLVAYGLAVLYSAGQTDVVSTASSAWERQLVWLAIGAMAAAFVFRFSMSLVEWITPAIYVGAMALLAVTLVFGSGAGTALGTKSWLTIGGVRLGQPAEIAKIAVVLMLARHFANRRSPPESMTEMLPASIITVVPFLLVAAQPDLGSAIVFGGILFASLFWAGVRPTYLFLLASPLVSLLLAFSTPIWGAWALVVFAVVLGVKLFMWEGVTVMMTNVFMGVVALPVWQGLAPYQQNRLLAFLNPEVDPRATGWHVIQSKVAIGSGGLTGLGYLDGPQKRLAFLPEQDTDFVFSVLGEELGFIGVTIALTLFALLLLQLVRIAQRAPDVFSSLVVFGIVGLLFTHIYENVGMTVNIMPITGIPLPFFSYGGSFTIVTSAAIGLSLRVAWETRSSGYAVSQEFPVRRR